jgi:hypothetical protein
VTRRASHAGWWLFLLALVLRLAWVAAAQTGLAATAPYPDELIHWQLADNLVHRGELVTDDGRYAARMPLYPLFLAPFAALGATGPGLARLAQALLGAASVWLVYRLARSALGRRPAAVAGLLAAVDPYAVFFANLLLTEIPFTLAGLAFAAAAWHLWRRPHVAAWPAVLAVAALGPTLILLRPSAAGWTALVYLILVWSARQPARALARTAVFALLFTLALLPWGLRNRAVLGGYAWLSANGGVTLYDAQGPQARGDSDQTFLAELTATRPEFAAAGELERDQLLRRWAVEQMQRDPLRVLRLAAVKFARTWNPWPNVAEHSGGLTGTVSAIYTLVVLIAAAVAVWRVWPPHGRPRRWLILLAVPVLYFTLVHCVYVGSLRYRIPIIPFMVLTAATALRPQQTPSPAAPPHSAPRVGRR